MTALAWFGSFVALAWFIFVCSVILGGFIGFGSCDDKDQ